MQEDQRYYVRRLSLSDCEENNNEEKIVRLFFVPAVGGDHISALSNMLNNYVPCGKSKCSISKTTAPECPPSLAFSFLWRMTSAWMDIVRCCCLQACLSFFVLIGASNFPDSSDHFEKLKRKRVYFNQEEYNRNSMNRGCLKGNVFS